MQEGGRRGNMVQRMTKEEQALGYKLLLYISYCLAGRAYPTGDIPAKVGHGLVRCW